MVTKISWSWILADSLTYGRMGLVLESECQVVLSNQQQIMQQNMYRANSTYDYQYNFFIALQRQMSHGDYYGP